MSLPPFVPLVLLGLSICSVWAPDLKARRVSVPPWTVLFTGAAASALSAGVLAWPGLLALTVMLAVSALARGVETPASRAALTSLAALFAIVLGLHVVPGFHNPVVVAGVRLGDNAAAFTQYANFDKGAAGLLLLVFFCRRARTTADWRRLIRPTITIAGSTALVVTAVAFLAGYVRPDLKLPHFALAFLAINLLFTCVAEESFFRGLLQERLMCATALHPRLTWLPIVVSSTAFGLVHAAGGVRYVMLTTLAGVGYSLAYALTRRIEAP
ncbi:MAG: CPBP family intramembrane glutamic endopeptidase, partial [Burkholderiales bacterium]